MSETTDELIAAVQELREKCDRVTIVSRVLVAESLDILEETKSLREYWVSSHPLAVRHDPKSGTNAP